MNTKEKFDETKFEEYLTFFGYEFEKEFKNKTICYILVSITDLELEYLNKVNAWYVIKPCSDKIELVILSK